MSASTPALLVAAAGVGLGHAVMPDHWMPLAVVGRVNRYGPGRVARLAALAGVAHVVFSLLLGAVIVTVGLQFRSSIESAQDTIVGAILLLTGILFAAVELSGRGHHGHGHGHDDGHGHGHDDGHDREDTSLFTVLIPLGAAASPDLTILPVFLAAAAVGVAAAVGALVVFAAATIATIIALTVTAFLTGYKLEGHWMERWGNLITAGVLLIIGTLVITRII